MSAPLAATPVLANAATLGYGTAAVLHDVSFTLSAGTATALLGDNGAGKSTILKAILGLSDVLAGRIEVLGATPRRRPRGSVGYVPQHIDAELSFPISAIDVVALGLVPELGWFGRVRRSGYQRCEAALDQVGLLDRAQQRFGELSGGQRQRVMLARALVAEPKVLLLDEPFNGLDRASRAQLLKHIEQLKKQGIALLAATHDLQLSEAVCEQVLHVEDGTVVS
ncbi:ABC transporter ATP-binding protein [Staphylococcus chromogenes]|nr:ABC transporter ATP-binding protein [Staphylococcus chromogenes]